MSNSIIVSDVETMQDTAPSRGSVTSRSSSLKTEQRLSMLRGSEYYMLCSVVILVLRDTVVEPGCLAWLFR